MKGRLNITVVGLVLTMFVVFICMGGCGSCGEKIAREAMEKAIEQSSGTDIEIEQDGNTISFSGEDGQGQFSLGENVKVPNDWPAEAKIYEGAKAVMVMVSADGAFGTFQTADSVDKVTEFYKGHFNSNGWKEVQVTTTPMGKQLAYTKNEDVASVTITPPEKQGDPTTFVLTFAKDQP